MAEIELRPYQQEARDAVLAQWDGGHSRTLLVLPTGCGKTIVFSAVIREEVKRGHRVLVLAHRAELLQQAADKLNKTTGLGCSVEKAEESCFGSWFRVTVGSVQSLCRPTRLAKFSEDYFDTIIIDEAHHALSASYQAVLDHFSKARVLGVTATPERGDHRNLGQYFESLAYEYTLPEAIHNGYLCPIRAQTIPLQIDLSGVTMQNGDYAAGSLGNALDPYLEQIADKLIDYAGDRKTVVFLPLIATSQKFCQLLNDRGMKAAEVNGDSENRAEILQAFDKGEYQVLCNSMLLTEGWDCPSVDCIVVLRPTKIRGLYCLDESTEVLTPDGWKNDVSIGDEVAAFDKETGKIKFVPALAKVRRHLEPDEFFCSINGQSTSIRVTNKHRMLYDNKRHTGWKFKTAEELADLNDGAYLPVSGHSDFKGVSLSDDELRFIGWVMTDGSINKTNNAITITQESHQPWLEDIQKCIDGCNLKYRRHERFIDSGYKRTSPVVWWTISKGKPRGTHKDRRGWGYLEEYISKDISTKLFDMTERQFDVMLEAIHLGDGHKQHSKNWTQHSYHISKGNREFIERLQIMAIQRGYRANITCDSKTNQNPIWTIHLKKQEFVKVGSLYGEHSTWEKEPHSNEMCWCVENELGTLVTRHNGKVSIVGNCQMIGRGTRLFPGKENLLLLDFLWMIERHELCRPACLICKDDAVARKMTENMEDGEAVDLEEAEEEAESDVINEREQALAQQLAAMRKKKARLVDPLQFAMSIHSYELANYQPSFLEEEAAPTQKTIDSIEKLGIFAGEIKTQGEADQLLRSLHSRIDEGLSTPKQIRFLEQRGFKNVGMWKFEDANKMIGRISANNWKIPWDINPRTYLPKHEEEPQEKLPWE